MTIEQYLKGQFEDSSFTDLNISVALVSWGVTEGIEHSSVTEKQKDLATSNLYVVLASKVAGGGEKTTKGNRSISKRTVSFGITDRDNFLTMAISLRRKWGIDPNISAGDGSSAGNGSGSSTPILPDPVYTTRLVRLFDRRR